MKNWWARGEVPNQNRIEAHHSSIKKVAPDHLRAAISHVFAGTLSKILNRCGRDGSMITSRTFGPGPINKGKTKHAIAQIQRYYFNEDYYVVYDENLYSLKVTKALTTKYTKSVNGILHVEDKFEDIQLSYQSLRAVDVEHHRALFHD
ncbi:hypothetical protein PHMEG_00022112 [Phytophthora megakarya]|uniref:Uncharacterized protein n=1 Tax=Phytophthora megakarya TaxID=4795 RepID=A0A225VLV0_9STRA|nr:hypothetical protein PHMEG_00022112 [Phytophthora megakarya]